jgi:hypothetical protein
MCSGAGDTTQLVPGFPIRTPWDHSSVDSSPRPIAASHVLHRLLVPRHPPCALSNLTTKMLASTVQFSTNATPPTHTTHDNQPPQDQQPRPGSASRRTGQQPHVPLPENPTPPPGNQTGPPTGAGCFFRTQQGVHPRSTNPEGPPPPAAPHPGPPPPTTRGRYYQKQGRCRP